MDNVTAMGDAVRRPITDDVSGGRSRSPAMRTRTRACFPGSVPLAPCVWHPTVSNVTDVLAAEALHQATATLDEAV